ncbi:MAG: LLM class flavin-dependent oxidoreductase [Actinobacteria bacterium]|nr:LLM class flavin-dependent oxidoreductase [Actinomycetota bacterium]
MQLGLCVLPPDLGAAAELAATADRAGLGWFGMCDSPYLYVDVHQAMLRAAQSSRRMRVGSFVTNPVTRHWSVQAAGFRGLQEEAGARAFLGIGPGDSAVHSVGLKPARIAALAEYVERVRAHAGDELEVMVAAGGPKGVAAAAAYADHVVLGQGVAPEALELLRAAAVEGAERAGRSAPPRLWLFLILQLAEDADGVEAARADVRSPVVSYSRQALDHTFDGKAVPEHLQAPLRELYTGFSFEDYSRAGASANARLLASAGDGEIEPFLFDRFAVVDTPERVAERLHEIELASGVAGVFMSIVSSDPKRLVELLGERLIPRLTELEAEAR